ncbi:MAG: RNA methyltransferase, partial [Fibrobacter sp.]|nr:RNA methyltransferase [Fibrobacter sp.]
DAVAERLYKVIESGSIPTPGHSDEGQNQFPKPEQALYVTLIDDRCTIMLDLAGEELYKRGHERFVNDAPLKETLAAGMILETIEILRLRAAHSAQDDTAPANITLIDPMAGSGTFSLEAAYMASGLIPGKCRDFALKHQPAFKPATWNHIVNSTSHTPHSTSHTIVTSDISERAVEITRHNVEHSPLATIAPGLVDPQVRDFFSYKAEDFKPLAGQTVILLNPPYGKRLNFDAPKLYAKIGKHLQNECGDGNRFKDGIHIAILCPKEACREKLLQNCPALDPSKNRFAREIFTSHGGFGLSCFVV